MKEKTCEEFIDALASKSPTPGGGGATALVGAISAALGSMVTNLTIGKKKYQEIEEELMNKQSKLKKLQEKFLLCIQKDADNFMPLYFAYSLPKKTIEEQTSREKALEEALEQAIQVPMELMNLCEETIDINIFLLQKGGKNVVSDAACGITLAEAAMKMASYNIFINTKLMKNQEKAEQFNTRIYTILEKNQEKVRKIEPEIEKHLKR
mgnify:CR=1 FL=1